MGALKSRAASPRRSEREIAAKQTILGLESKPKPDPSGEKHLHSTAVELCDDRLEVWSAGWQWTVFHALLDCQWLAAVSQLSWALLRLDRIVEPKHPSGRTLAEHVLLPTWSAATQQPEGVDSGCRPSSVALCCHAAAGSCGTVPPSPPADHPVPAEEASERSLLDPGEAWRSCERPHQPPAACVNCHA